MPPIPDVVFKPTGEHTASLIFLHGLGDTSAGWAELFKSLRGVFPNVKMVLPTAPEQPGTRARPIAVSPRLLTPFSRSPPARPSFPTVTLNMGMSMPSWYDIKGLDARANESCDGIDQSKARVDALIKEELDAGIPANRIILGGFSQGAGVAYYTGLQQSEPLAGILAMSGYLPKSGDLANFLKSKDTPVLHCHGEADQVVRLVWAEESIAKLKEAGVNPTFKTYPGMQHSSDPNEVRDVVAWMQQRLA